MTEIVSIGTAVPAYCHRQQDIRLFMDRVYALPAADSRKMRFLYQQSAIDCRYSVVPDYSLPAGQWVFYPPTESLEPFPSLEKRMEWYDRHAPELSLAAIGDCLKAVDIPPSGITHIISVSCTGLKAPGLELALQQALQLSPATQRHAINFMGCYAAIHGLRQADLICRADPAAVVLLLCTELCTLHFQKAPAADNIAASLLFGDGSAAVLLRGGGTTGNLLKGFYGEVAAAGSKDMSWGLSSSGFRMTLSGYVPDLLSTDFEPMLCRAFEKYGLARAAVANWCIHPGGKRLLEAIGKSLQLTDELQASYEVLRRYGNMSSPTVLFVLKEILEAGGKGPVLAAAFGPGLTMETCWLEAGVS
ncbi:MAG: type III polyketide synthase [Flavihumibacter sp.]